MVRMELMASMEPTVSMVLMARMVRMGILQKSVSGRMLTEFITGHWTGSGFLMTMETRFLPQERTVPMVLTARMVRTAPMARMDRLEQRVPMEQTDPTVKTVRTARMASRLSCVFRKDTGTSLTIMATHGFSLVRPQVIRDLRVLREILALAVTRCSQTWTTAAALIM